MAQVTDPSILAKLNGGAPTQPAPRPGMRPVFTAPRSSSQALEDTSKSVAIAKGQQDLQDAPLNRSVTEATLQDKTTTVRFKPAEQALKLADNYRQEQAVKDYNAAIANYGSLLTTKPTPQGDLSLIYSFAKIMDPGSVVREGEMDLAKSTSPVIQQIYARYGKELEGGGALSDASRRELRMEAANKMGALNEAYLTARVNYKKMADRYGLNPLDVVGEHPGIRFQDAESRLLGRPITKLDYNGNPIKPDAPVGGQPRNPNDPNGAFQGQQVQFNMDKPEEVAGYRAPKGNEQAYLAFIASQNGNPNFSLEMANAFLQRLGEQPLPGDAKDLKWVEAVRSGKAGTSQLDYSRNDQAAKDRAAAEAKVMEQQSGQAGLQELGTSGALMGGYDEATGVGKAIGALLTGDTNVIQNYQTGRDGMRVRLQQARDNTGALGTVTEIGSGVLTGGVGAITNPVRAAVRGGALAGFNSGEGPQGSATNALLGAGGGLALSKGLPAATNALLESNVGQKFTNFINQRAAARSPTMNANAPEVINAAQAEGVPISRPMVDDTTFNNVVALRSRPGSAPVMERGFKATDNALESKVALLGRGGSSLEVDVAGDRATSAAQRIAKQLKAGTDRAYKKAEQLAGNAAAGPRNALQEVNNQIAELEATPNANKALIDYLKEVKGDLIRPGGLTIEAFRSLRRSIPTNIEQKSLTRSDAGRRMKLVMDAASRDIEEALGSNSAALNAYRQADKMFGQRQDYMRETLKPIFGDLADPLAPAVDPQVAWSRIQALAKPGAASGRLERFWKGLTPDEANDFAATIADRLGANDKGVFTAADLVSKAKNLSPKARRVVFGEEGAKSLENLITVAQARSRVPYNTSGSGVAMNYGGWLPATLGVISGGVTQAATTSPAMAGAAMAAGAAAGSIKTGANILSARAIMNKDVTNWIRTAPNTINPKAINAHFERLTAIAARNPGIAQEINALQSFLMDAANSVPGKLAARENENNGGPNPPQ